MLKTFFRNMSALMVWLYRRSHGKIGGRVQGLPVLLLTTTGRKTGQPRVTPLGYFEHDGAYVIIASYAGFDTHPAWFLNLQHHPQVALEIGDQRLTALAEPAHPPLRQQLWDKLVALAPGYKAYQQRTTREIPVVLLRPVSR